MDTTGSVALSRQSGLLREMQVVANNIANAATTGFRQEGLVFAEHVRRMEDAPSVSMARAHVRATSMVQGSLTATGGTFDLAIEGDGFFLIETPAGERLTRAGHFTPNADGDLVTPEGFRVLDAGGRLSSSPPGRPASPSPPTARSVPGPRPLARSVWSCPPIPCRSRARMACGSPRRTGRSRPMPRGSCKAASRRRMSMPFRNWPGWSRCSAPTNWVKAFLMPRISASGPPCPR